MKKLFETRRRRTCETVQWADKDNKLNRIKMLSSENLSSPEQQKHLNLVLLCQQNFPTLTGIRDNIKTFSYYMAAQNYLRGSWRTRWKLWNGGRGEIKLLTWPEVARVTHRCICNMSFSHLSRTEQLIRRSTPEIDSAHETRVFFRGDSGASAGKCRQWKWCRGTLRRWPEATHKSWTLDWYPYHRRRWSIRKFRPEKLFHSYYIRKAIVQFIDEPLEHQQMDRLHPHSKSNPHSTLHSGKTSPCRAEISCHRCRCRNEALLPAPSGTFRNASALEFRTLKIKAN